MTDVIEAYVKASGIIAINGYGILMCLNHSGTYELPGGRRDPTKALDKYGSHCTALREFVEEVPVHVELPALKLILSNLRYIHLTPDKKWAYIQYFFRWNSLNEDLIMRLNASRAATFDTRACYNEVVSYKLVDFRKLHEIKIRDRDVDILANVRPWLYIIGHFTRTLESVGGYYGIVVTMPKIPKTDTSHRKRPARRKVQAVPLRKRVSGQ